jgi:hypothetical protein
MRLFAVSARHSFFAQALLLGVAFFSIPNFAHAQYSSALSTPKAVGVAIWAGVSQIRIGAAPDSAPAKTRGLVDTLPETIQGQGGSVALNYGTWGVNLAATYFNTDINKKADLQQDGDTSNDSEVVDMKGQNFAINFLYRPIRHVYVGYGVDIGTLTFQVVDPKDSQRRNEKIAYTKPFYVLAFAFGFDPDIPKIAPFFTVYGKFPGAPSDVSGVTYGAGVGVYF